MALAVTHAHVSLIPDDPTADVGSTEWNAGHTLTGFAAVAASGAAADISGLAASATTDTTNASNITTGTLPAAQLPSPTASTLGGVESLAAVTHNFLTSIGTNGAPTQAQPAWTDLSGISLCIMNAANYTLTSQTGAQQMFNTSTAGAVTLAAGTYKFRCLWAATTFSSVSGTVSWGLAGGSSGPATFTQAWLAVGGRLTALSTVTNNGNASWHTALEAITIASVLTTASFLIEGYINVTVGGTIVPQIAMSQASAAVVQAGSYFEATLIGGVGVTTIGTWT